LGKWAQGEGFALEQHARDEFDDEALRCCTPLVLHHSVDGKQHTSSSWPSTSGKISSSGIIRPTRGIDWKSLPTLSDLLCGRIKGRENAAQITGFVNNIGLVRNLQR